MKAKILHQNAYLQNTSNSMYFLSKRDLFCLQTVPVVIVSVVLAVLLLHIALAAPFKMTALKGT